MENCEIMEAHGPIALIDGLPDDIALGCIARVPRRYHYLLRCVSRKWRDLLASNEWLSCRQKNNFEETWIYAFCREHTHVYSCYVLDPCFTNRCWRPMHTFPSQYLKDGMSFEAIKNKLYLFGGCTWTKDASDQVYSYDAATEKWEEATSMPTPRCYFSSVVLDQKLYISGGVDLETDAAKIWDIYDPSSNCWTSQSDPMLSPNIRKSVTLDGNIYTFHKKWNSEPHVGVFNPNSKTPDGVSNELALCLRGPTVVVDDILFMLDESSGTRLMMWNKNTDEWVALGRLSSQLTRPPCQLVAFGRSIVVIGQGLSTLFIDVDKAVKADGILVSSSIMPKVDIKVISCKTIAI